MACMCQKRFNQKCARREHSTPDLTRDKLMSTAWVECLTYLTPRMDTVRGRTQELRLVSIQRCCREQRRPCLASPAIMKPLIIHPKPSIQLWRPWSHMATTSMRNLDYVLHFQGKESRARKNQWWQWRVHLPKGWRSRASTQYPWIAYTLTSIEQH